MGEYNIISTNELSLNQQNQIYQLLLMCDREFIPPLSDRYSTRQMNLKPIIHKGVYEPELYFADILKYKLLLAVDNYGKIIGFLAYQPDTMIDIDKTHSILADYVSTVIVSPNYRNQGVAKQLYAKLFQQPSIDVVVVRTWHTNIPHIKILQSLHFGEIYTIRNDRCDGIHTVYYYRRINYLK